MPFERLSPIVSDEAPSLADKAYAAMRDGIIDGSLAPGSKLPERALAAALGVSPQPVRDALRRLEAEGLAELKPRSGSYVSIFTEDRLIEMGLIRAALESIAAGIAARRRTAADIAALEACMKAVTAATSSGDDRRLAAMNDRLHATIHTMTGNAVLIRNLRAMRAYYHISSRKNLVRPGEFEDSFKEHSAIVEAIIAGEDREAETRMAYHTRRNLLAAFPNAPVTL